MKYLIRTTTRSQKKKRAHIWLGNDTACTMYSTGGLRKGNTMLSDDSLGLPICLMCSNNAKLRSAER